MFLIIWRVVFQVQILVKLRKIFFQLNEYYKIKVGFGKRQGLFFFYCYILFELYLIDQYYDFEYEIIQEFWLIFVLGGSFMGENCFFNILLSQK